MTGAGGLARGAAIGAAERRPGPPPPVISARLSFEAVLRLSPPYGAEQACLAHALLWLAHAHDGCGADVWGRLSPAGEREGEAAERRESAQAALLERCLLMSMN